MKNMFLTTMLLAGLFGKVNKVFTNEFFSAHTSFNQNYAAQNLRDTIARDSVMTITEKDMPVRVAFEDSSYERFSARYNQVVTYHVIVTGIKHFTLRDTAYSTPVEQMPDEDSTTTAPPISSTLKTTITVNPILYSEDFEDTNVNGLVWMKEAIDSTRGITTSADVARKNGRSAKFSFDFSDWSDVDSLQPDGHRTELHPRHGTIPGRFDLNKDYWIGFSDYFPSTWSLDPTTTIVWQFHGYGGTDSLAGGSNQPPLYGSVNANKSFVNIQIYDSNQVMHSIGKVNIVKGQWNDWIMHVKFGYKGGFDTVWVNGTMVAAYKGSNFYHVPNQITDFGPYLKMGLYKPSWGDAGITGQASNLTIYDDALVIGNNKATYEQIKSFF